MAPEAWYEIYVNPWNQELAKVGMRVLSQVSSASSCERNWSAPWHLHIKIRKRLDPATTKGLSTFTQTAKWWQGLGIQANSRCSLGIMKTRVYSHPPVCLQRAMSVQAQDQALIKLGLAGV